MAYQDAGLMENWIVDRINIDTIAPKAAAQDTGTFEDWIVDRIHFLHYAEADAVVGGDPDVIAQRIQIPRTAQQVPGRDHVIRI